MKTPKSILFLVFISLHTASYSQDSTKNLPKNTRRQPIKYRPTPLPTLPMFPGGKDSLAAFIKKHTRYPKEAQKHNISGTIEVDFTVAVDGTIKKPKVLKSLGYGCDEEAIRVVHLMPKWIPSKKGRDPMELYYHVNIPFGKQEKQFKKPKP